MATLPKELQAAIIAAGAEAGEYGRQVESGEDGAKLEALEKAGRLKRITFEERDAMKKLTDPVMAAYAKEVGAEAIFGQVSGA
jgi:TRAP-type C4-dicarboxylate transport system substrate-binding protein